MLEQNLEKKFEDQQNEENQLYEYYEKEEEVNSNSNSKIKEKPELDEYL